MLNQIPELLISFHSHFSLASRVLNDFISSILSSTDKMTAHYLWIHDLASTAPVMTAAIVLLFIFIVDYMGDARVFDAKGTLIPGPRSNLYGINFISVVRKARKNYQGTKAMMDVLLPHYGYDICASKLFGLSIVVLSHPDHIKSVLSGSHTKFPKAHKYNRLKFFLGNGLVTSSGKLWQTHRALISPSFTADSLKGMVKLFSAHCNRQVRKLFSLCDKANSNSIDIDLNLELWELTLSIICDAAFGYDVNSEGNDADFETMKPLFFEIADEMNNRILDLTDWWHLVRPNHTSQAAVKKLQTLIEKIIIKRLNDIEENVSRPSETLPSRGHDLLNLLIRAQEGEKLNAEELRDHSLTFFGAGHETTSTTLLWTFYELARHPEVLQKCHEEIDKVVGDDYDLNSIISYEQISEFVYINQVVKEVLRMHPAAQMLGRRSVEKSQIGPYLLPPNTNIGICVLAVHHHSDFWDRPYHFLPERFSPENIKHTLKHPFQYIPFSAGPRNCIGARFATMEMIVSLVKILKPFTFRIDHNSMNEIRIEETVTCAPKNMRIILEKR